jgi:hypothetical protein
MVSTAHAAAEQTVSEANQHAETTVSAAMAQAKQQLDDATARATAIHDGSERRLNLLISRHTETVRRLTEIRDVVTGLVAGEVSRGSLEDEVNRALGAQQAANGAAGSDGRTTAQQEQGQPAPQRSPRQAAAADSRRTVAAQREEPAAPSSAPAPATRQPAATATRSHAAPIAPIAPVALDHDQEDPLATAAQRAADRYQTETPPTPPAGKHVTDAAMQAAEEIRQGRKTDRVLDETAAGSATRADT